MKNKKNPVTHEDVQAALRNFQSRGGLIQQLPAEVALKPTLVGNKWSMYETGDDSLGNDMEQTQVA